MVYYKIALVTASFVRSAVLCASMVLLLWAECQRMLLRIMKRWTA